MARSTGLNWEETLPSPLRERYALLVQKWEPFVDVLKAQPPGVDRSNVHARLIFFRRAAQVDKLYKRAGRLARGYARSSNVGRLGGEQAAEAVEQAITALDEFLNEHARKEK